MSSRTLMRTRGMFCIVGGIILIVFVLIHPWDRLIGASNALDPRWQLAHRLHFVGAICALLGLPGIYAMQCQQLGTLGTIGFALSFLGNAMFLGTGMITAFIWPMLALCALQSVELGGALFGSLGSLSFLLTAATMMVGYVLFGGALLRIGMVPGGTRLGMRPPPPLTALRWAVMVLGGVLYGAGLAWVGSVLWTTSAQS